MIDLSRDPLFKLDDIHDLTKDQIRERTMAKLYIPSSFSLLLSTHSRPPAPRAAPRWSTTSSMSPSTSFSKG